MVFDPATIFFSYSRTDAAFVLKIAKALRKDGASLWIDQLDIPSGARWDEAVESALRDCSCLVVVLSPASAGSQNVMDEVGYALEERKTVIPLVIAPCNIPFRLKRIQHIDFAAAGYDAGYRELLGAVRRVQPVRRAAPAQPPPSRFIPPIHTQPQEPVAPPPSRAPPPPPPRPEQPAGRQARPWRSEPPAPPPRPPVPTAPQSMQSAAVLPARPPEAPPPRRPEAPPPQSVPEPPPPPQTAPVAELPPEPVFVPPPEPVYAPPPEPRVEEPMQRIEPSFMAEPAPPMETFEAQAPPDEVSAEASEEPVAEAPRRRGPGRIAVAALGLAVVAGIGYALLPSTRQPAGTRTQEASPTVAANGGAPAAPPTGAASAPERPVQQGGIGSTLPASDAALAQEAARNAAGANAGAPAGQSAAPPQQRPTQVAAAEPEKAPKPVAPRPPVTVKPPERQASAAPVVKPTEPAAETPQAPAAAQPKASEAAPAQPDPAAGKADEAPKVAEAAPSARPQDQAPRLADATPAAKPTEAAEEAVPAPATPAAEDAKPAEKPAASAAPAETVASAAPNPQPTAKGDDGQLRDLVNRYVAAQNRADISGLLALYDDRVDFLGNRIANHDFIRRYRQEFYRQWPQVETHVIGPVDIKWADAKNADVSFTTFIHVRNPALSNPGKARSDLHVRQVNGKMKIVSERQTVLDTPS